MLYGFNYQGETVWMETADASAARDLFQRIFGYRPEPEDFRGRQVSHTNRAAHFGATA